MSGGVVGVVCRFCVVGADAGGDGSVVEGRAVADPVARSVSDDMIIWGGGDIDRDDM